MSLESTRPQEVPGTVPDARISPSPEVVAAQLATARRVAAMADREQAESRKEAQAVAEGAGSPTASAAAPDRPERTRSTTDKLDALGSDDDVAGAGAQADKAVETPERAPTGGEAETDDKAAQRALMAKKEDNYSERDHKKIDQHSAMAEAMDAIGPDKAAAVQAQAARTIAFQPELCAGVPRETVEMAVLVAGAPDLRKGLSADAADKFDKAVGSIEAAGDAKFREMVAKLRSPDDRRAVTEAYEKAKADGKTPIVTDNAEHLVIADPLRQGVPGQRFDVRPGGRLSRKSGRLEVVPPSDSEQAKGLLEVSALVRRHPFDAVPEPFWRQVIAAVNLPSVREKYGPPGAMLRDGFDLSKGTDSHNVAVLCQAGEQLLGPGLFADPDSGSPAPSASLRDGEPAERWREFQERAAATSMTVELRRRLAERGKKKAETPKAAA